MKVSELLDQQMNEDWKTKAAAAATSAALTLGGLHLYNTKIKTPAQSVETKKQLAGVKSLMVKTLTNHKLEKVLLQAAYDNNIRGIELAQFMAQCAHESTNFTKLIEARSNASSEKMYMANKSLGNKYPGDGSKFKGRGFIQLTGRWNYNQMSKALNYSFIDKPHLLEDPHIAAEAAIWYWKNRVASKTQDFSNTKAVTYYINSGLKGLADRIAKFEYYSSTLKK